MGRLVFSYFMYNKRTDNALGIPFYLYLFVNNTFIALGQHVTSKSREEKEGMGTVCTNISVN